ncbi:MAG: histidinol dehydrogenase [Pseudomonadota bacterium]
MKLPIYQWSDLTASERQDILARPAVSAAGTITETVRDIIDAVRREGDMALREYGAQFDKVRLDDLRVSTLEFADAELSLGFRDREAILLAIDNIRRFHEAQQRADIDMETAPGVRCQRLTRPIQAVGLYVPAGSAPLPSAAMMLAIPAAIAGCPTRVLCTPPDQDGNVDPAILFAAHESGIRDVFKVGGAQAIAAMAYGTETIPKVYKLFGPGNAYVTEAKAQAAGDPRGAAQDMPAGPSEVLVIADATARPHYVAADLLSQAEHGPDSPVVLLTDSASLIEHVVLAIEQQLTSLPRRKTIRQALKNSALIEVATIDEAIRISNRYAPEHLIINTKDARNRLVDVHSAGSVFLGSLTPESLGDYCSGTNHVLPTYGYARNYSGLGVDQFCLQMSVQEVTADGLRNIGPTAARLAQLERLDAHRLAVDLRLEDLDD